MSMSDDPKGVRYADLYKMCAHYFGEPRQNRTSHATFKTPWPGNPRVNIQNDKGKAKAYQVRQVLEAIDKKGGAVNQTVVRPEVSHYAYRVVGQLRTKSASLPVQSSHHCHGWLRSRSRH